MKELKNTQKIILDNKNQLLDYISDFHPVKFEEILNLFNIDDYNCGYYVFKGKMKYKIGMPKNGKETLIYWTSRGWSKEESLSKRKKPNKNPETSPMNLNFWIKRGLKEEESLFKIKSQRKMNIEYWISKGFSKEDSEIKRSEYQSEQAYKFQKKKLNNPELYDDIHDNQVNYWIKRGYSIDEAIKNISVRQSTFSKNICINKYGYDLGIKIWKERQDKWIESLSTSEYNLSDGKAVPIKDKLIKYKIEETIDSLTLNNRNLYKKLFKECVTIEEFINSYGDYFKNDNDEISLYRILRPIMSLKILHEYYNTNKEHILSLLIPKISRVKQKYSYISWINNHICRSDAEYIIANFLLKNDINYIYEKRYENSKMKCDFYLTDYKTYVEYLGMRIDVYKTKIDFLNINKIKYLCSSDINDIKIKILNCVNNKNK